MNKDAIRNLAHTLASLVLIPSNAFRAVEAAYADGAFDGDAGMTEAFRKVRAARVALLDAEEAATRLAYKRTEGLVSAALEEQHVRAVLAQLAAVLGLVREERDKAVHPLAAAFGEAAARAFHPKCKQCGGRGVYGDDFCSADCEESYRPENDYAPRWPVPNGWTWLCRATVSLDCALDPEGNVRFCDDMVPFEASWKWDQQTVALGQTPAFMAAMTALRRVESSRGPHAP